MQHNDAKYSILEISKPLAMPVIYKLVLSLFALSLTVFGIYGIHQLYTEQQELRIAVEQETRLLAYSLLVSVENALRDHQTEDIQELLRQLERIDPAIDVRIYIKNHAVIKSDAESLNWPGEIEQALYQTVTAGEVKLFYFPDKKPDLMVLSLPFSEPTTQLLGNLVVMRSLSNMQEDLRKTELSIVLSLFSSILFTSLLCWFLGNAYISRPLGRLRQAMRNFRDATRPIEPLPIQGRDEITAVTKEFNRMTTELLSAHKRLDIEIQQRRQLQRALQDADKLITIGQLSAGLAHEIGSPLQVVNGRARALVKCSDNADEVKRIATILVAQTDRITRIVQRLLGFVPQQSVNKSQCNAIKAIADVIDMLGYEAQRRHIKLVFRHPEKLPLAPVGQDSLQQIVLNLLTNALAAIAGTGTINIELSETTTHYAGKTLPALQLTVTDTGEGIAPENIPHIFDLLFTTRNNLGGIGLGLAVVKTIVSESGGTIATQSELNQGSRFIVHLPLKDSLS